MIKLIGTYAIVDEKAVDLEGAELGIRGDDESGQVLANPGTDKQVTLVKGLASRAEAVKALEKILTTLVRNKRKADKSVVTFDKVTLKAMGDSLEKWVRAIESHGHALTGALNDEVRWPGTAEEYDAALKKTFGDDFAWQVGDRVFCVRAGQNKIGKVASLDPLEVEVGDKWMSSVRVQYHARRWLGSVVPIPMRNWLIEV